MSFNVNYCSCSDLTQYNVTVQDQLKQELQINKLNQNLAISTIYCCR
jgi:hypothetical protein